MSCLLEFHRVRYLLLVDVSLWKIIIKGLKRRLNKFKDTNYLVFYKTFVVLTFSFVVYLEVNFRVFVLFRFNDIDLRNIFCIRIITRPKPNSTAESINKKNVKDSKLILLKIRPIIKVITYKVIHMNSAVRRRCRDVLTFKTTLKKIMKNRINKRFRSPKDMSYYYVYTFDKSNKLK